MLVHTTDPNAWTPQDVTTAVIASISAIISLASVLVAILAVTQAGRYYARPHFTISGTGQGQGENKPAYMVFVTQRGPADAHNAEIWMRRPGDSRWIWVHTLSEMKAHSSVSFTVGLASLRDHVVWSSSKYTTTPGEPIYGLWKWKVKWEKTPDPTKIAEQVYRHRVTKRRAARNEYLSVG